MLEVPRYMPDRRRHARTRVKMMLKGIRLDPDGGDVVETLHMQDISRGGLGAVVTRSFYPGQRMVLSLPLSRNAGKRSIHARIVHCSNEDGCYRVGLEFDATSVGNWCGVSTRMAAA
ncbi:MAG: PilZ domain-containing protein [Planctomycetota bacterium]